jgi:hypothetical protein
LHLELSNFDRISWRGTLAGCNVIVHQHLDGTLSMTHGPRRLERYTSQGTPITQAATKQAVESRSVEKSKCRLFHLAWKSRKQRRIPLSNSYYGG